MLSARRSETHVSAHISSNSSKFPQPIKPTLAAMEGRTPFPRKSDYVFYGIVGYSGIK